MSTVESLFNNAARIDSTVKPSVSQLRLLQSKRILPVKYQRQTLFGNMARGKVSLFDDFPAPVHRHLAEKPDLLRRVLSAVETTRLSGKIRTRVGQETRFRYYTPAELIGKWRRNRAPINVTDFHIRGTAIEKILNPAVLSQFNFLPAMSDATSWIEMMTMVVSGEGGFSDSHSDDCDGSNYCFTGTKLWLAWDTRRGLDAGLEDSDQLNVTGRCAFDLDTFLKLSGAYWFTVEPGQTLFMPGHLSHKVITLAPYIGVGSFYLGFPNIISTLSRWQRQLPNWQRLEADSQHEIVTGEIINTAVKQLNRVASTSESNQQKWGLDFAAMSVRSWSRSACEQEKQRFRLLYGSQKLEQSYRQAS